MRRQLLPLLALLPLATGCVMSQTQYVESNFVQAEVEDSDQDEDGVEVLGHVYANSWGIYLFAKLPYLAGGIDEEGQPEWQYFADVVEVQTVVDLLEAEALRHGATHVIDLESDWISEWSAATLIFWIVEAQASATALRVTGEAPLDAIPIGNADQ